MKQRKLTVGEEPEKNIFTHFTPLSRKGLGRLSILQLQPAHPGYKLWTQAAWGQPQFWPLSGCNLSMLQENTTVAEPTSQLYPKDSTNVGETAEQTASS